MDGNETETRLDVKLAALAERVENIAENVTYLRTAAERNERLHGEVSGLRWAVRGTWAAITGLFGLLWGTK
jgi:hypothetical protein